ncbi:FecR domain-containing protein [Sulfurimonas sp. MAG313]|nr:FecR family protein [Sulfurimonas sp. MAG313]MDF1881452.1 FecR domain-containing protein [Sulfurimonas sp. MAG313]
MKLLILYLSLVSMLFSMPIEKHKNDTLEKTSVAVITKIDGKAKILSKSSIKKHKAKLGESLFEGDRLITYMQATVLVELYDSSKIIVAPSSELSFLDKNTLKQGQGEVYYKIKTRKASQGLKVETPFSIMGIKGTEFIVDSQGQGQIALKEGLVGIESLYANFELHKKKVMEEYEKFKSEQNSAFEAYKAESNGQIIIYVKAFDLESGKVLNFSQSSECNESCESKVQEIDISDELNRKFAMYEKMLKE